MLLVPEVPQASVYSNQVQVATEEESRSTRLFQSLGINVTAFPVA